MVLYNMLWHIMLEQQTTAFLLYNANAFIIFALLWLWGFQNGEPPKQLWENIFSPNNWGEQIFPPNVSSWITVGTPK